MLVKGFFRYPWRISGGRLGYIHLARDRTLQSDRRFFPRERHTICRHTYSDIAYRSELVPVLCLASFCG
jgi:hypothetical protein